MSPLTSQTELLHSVIFNGGKPTSDDVIACGLDLSLLEWIVDDLRPTMDYLRGYVSLDSDFKSTMDPDGRRNVPFPRWFQESGLSGHYPHCIKVLEATMFGGGGSVWYPLIPSERDRYPGEYNKNYDEDAQRLALVRVYLTRKGGWIIWSSYPTSKFLVASTATLAAQMVKQLAPKGATLYIYGRYGGRLGNEITSPALVMIHNLVSFVDASIDAKKKDVRREETRLDGINVLLSRFN